jgi:predicted phosphohydrolase
MSLFAIGDIHLSFGADKPMDIFSGWQDYEKRLDENWRAVVKDEDTVVVAGDISWAMRLEDTLPDFRFLDGLPGKKLIMKGNHDYWWSTKTKAERFFMQNGLSTLGILHNNAFRVGNVSVCGTRGWFFDCDEGDANKVLLREAIRLKASIDAAKKLGGEPVAFLHYPPVSSDGSCCRELFDVLKAEGIKRCYYGHLHGSACRYAVNGEFEGVSLSLISGDFLKFCPKLVEKY